MSERRDYEIHARERAERALTNFATSRRAYAEMQFTATDTWFNRLFRPWRIQIAREDRAFWRLREYDAKVCADVNPRIRTGEVGR